MFDFLYASRTLKRLFNSIPIGVAIADLVGDDLRWRTVSAYGKENLGFNPVGTFFRQSHSTAWESRVPRMISVLESGVPILREPSVYIDAQTGVERHYLFSFVRITRTAGLLTWIDVTIEAANAQRLQSAQNLLQHEISTDPLTGAGSRAKLQTLSATTPAGTIYVDLNKFKTVNDGLGHRAGDLLLCAVADRLQSRLSEAESLFRPAGDEFVVLLESPLVADELLARARSIARSLDEPFWLDRHEVRISAAIGVADHSAGNLDDQLVAADQAMYAAKSYARGRTEVNLWSQDQVDENRHKQQVSLELRRAVRNLSLEDDHPSEFALHYQPIVQIDNHSTIGYEALLRWNSPVLGSVPPGLFIPLAEVGSEIYEISQWVLETAARQLKEWPEAEIAVNLSPWDLERAGFRDRLLRLCDRLQIDPWRLSLEITERAVDSDLSHFEQVLADLAECKIRLSIDDFGTGDSGLLRVAQAIDWYEVKVDRSLLPSDMTDSRRQKICGGIVALCRRLDIHVLAEGIETKEQLEVCRALGFEHAQGYYFAKPLPPNLITTRATVSSQS